MGYHKRYRRVYTALVRYGFSPAKAIEIIIDAKRGRSYSLSFVRHVKKYA